MGAIATKACPGLKRAGHRAICGANDVARRPGPYYPVLYTGKNGMVAHEFIIDLRPIKEACGITFGDVAKRQVDYGFHALAARGLLARRRASAGSRVPRVPEPGMRHIVGARISAVGG